MTQIDLNASLYAKLQGRAQQSGQTIEEWLSHRVEPKPRPDLEALYNWFARLIAHDLRTPLAAILTSSDILKHYEDRMTRERKVEHLDTIQMQVRGLNNLLDNIMVIQKLEAGTLNFDPVSQDLAELCQSAISSAREVCFHETDVSFRAAGERHMIEFDEKLLGLALVNVLTNAFRFSPPDSPVTMQLATTPQQATIVVQDAGSGLVADELPHVFDLFFTGSNALAVGGKGLGLAVAQRIVVLHHGTIDLHSAVGQGTSVTISLPVN